MWRARAAGKPTAREGGAAAVELALVLVPLLVLLLGVVEVGRAFAMQFRLQQVARDTARAIALQYDDPTLPAGGIADVADDTLDQQLAGWNTSVVRSTLVYCTTVEPPPVPHMTTVTLEMPLSLAIPVGGAWLPTTIVGHARMPCEG